MSCGVPNMNVANDEDTRPRGRRKRVVGGVPAKPVSVAVARWAGVRWCNLGWGCRRRSSGRWLWRRTRRSTVAAPTSEGAGSSQPPTASGSVTRLEALSGFGLLGAFPDPPLSSRPRPSAFKVKFSLWRKSRSQDTTDIVPVQDIIIHPRF